MTIRWVASVTPPLKNAGYAPGASDRLKHYSDLGRETSSVRNFCSCSSDIISWWSQAHHKNVGCFLRLWTGVLKETFYCISYKLQGSYPFLSKKFKDFQGCLSHFSRTPLSAKKSLESVFFSSSTIMMSNFIPKVFLCLLLFLWSST